MNPSSSLCGLDFASRLANLAILFRPRSSLSGLLSGDLGTNVAQDNGNALSYLHLCLLMDGHNGMPVSRIRVGTQNEQVARAQHKPVRCDGLLGILGVGSTDMELALLTHVREMMGVLALMSCIFKAL